MGTFGGTLTTKTLLRAKRALRLARWALRRSRRNARPFQFRVQMSKKADGLPGAGLGVGMGATVQAQSPFGEPEESLAKFKNAPLMENYPMRCSRAGPLS